eukprot:g1403.t1
MNSDDLESEEDYEKGDDRWESEDEEQYEEDFEMHPQEVAEASYGSDEWEASGGDDQAHGSEKPEKPATAIDSQDAEAISKKLRLGRIEWDPVPGAQAYRVIEADGDAGGKEALLYCGSMTACVVEVAARKAYQIYALGENGAAGDPYTFTFASPSSASRPKQKQKQKQKSKSKKAKAKK